MSLRVMLLGVMPDSWRMVDRTPEKRWTTRKPQSERPSSCYTGSMMDELEFRRTAEGALEALKRHLIEREEEEDAGFEVEEQNGALNVLFANPPSKFVITPNTPVRQIWISALSTSFKLDWDAKGATFVLARTGEPMMPLVDRLIETQG